MATLKHISSKNSDYTAIESYLVYQHDEFSGKVILEDVYKRQQYACPGTQYNTYADGVYTSHSPLGPFVRQASKIGRAHV